MKLFQRRSHGWEKLDDKRVENSGRSTRQKARTPRLALRFTTRIRHFLSYFKPFVCYQELREECLNDPEPLKDGISFYCKWLGTSQVFKAQGTGCTDGAIKQIVEDAKKMKSSKDSREKKLQKVLVIVTTKSLKIEDMATKTLKMEIPIYRISYCTADPNYPKVFAFIARQQGCKVLQCHALLCNKESMAKAISLTVADAFSSAYDKFEDQTQPKITQPLREMTSSEVETQPSKPVSLLVLSQTTSTENTGNSFQDDCENNLPIKASNPFRNEDTNSNVTNPFTQEEKKLQLNKRPLSEYCVHGPHIKISGDEFLAAASSDGSSHSMRALDLAGATNYDDFDVEFTRLAEGRSNSNLFETPVRRSDLQEDLSTLLANENTALELMNSKSTEDLLF